MLQLILLLRHIALDAVVCFSLSAQTAVVEERGGYKFAESNNHGISFYLRLGVWGPPSPIRSSWVNAFETPRPIP